MAQLDTSLQGGDTSLQGVVVLQNGGLLKGRVTKAGDFYRVAIEGGEIRLRLAEVDLVCRDLEEAYQQKRAALVLGTAGEHANLARWLQRHGLFEHAATELALASKIDPSHPMIPVVRRRLETSLAEPKSFRSSNPVETIGPAVSGGELDQMTRELPRSTVEVFTRTIQPLLSHRCATAACHGSGRENGFSFRRLSYGGSPSRRATQRNLHATLQWVDRSRPTDSKLLTVPAASHGATGPIFSEKDAPLYNQLTAWVGLLADVGAERVGPEMPVVPAATAASEVVQAVHVSPSTMASPEGSAVELAGYSAEATSLGVNPSFTFPSPFGPPDAPALQRGARIPSFTPVDPFDPAIFNRRFHGQE